VARIAQPRAGFVCGVRGLHVTEGERLDSPKARVASLAERLLSPLVDVYDANSRAAVERLVDLGIDRDRLVYIPNGLDLSLWSPPTSDRGHAQVPLVVCAARLVEHKRHQDLLHALAILGREGHSFRAVLAGEGPLVPELRTLVSRLGLDSSVKLLGPVGTDGVRALLEEAAIACLSSASEGMPGSLMEAMASGVAVVGTDVSGTNELVVDGESGLLVPPYDPPALARALGTLLDDPPLRRRLAAGGRQRMEDCFSLDVMLDAKLRLYRDMAARAG
jgi:glycosyltransferase involved in cell wall biosynthesis